MVHMRAAGIMPPNPPRVSFSGGLGSGWGSYGPPIRHESPYSSVLGQVGGRMDPQSATSLLLRRSWVRLGVVWTPNPPRVSFSGGLGSGWGSYGPRRCRALFAAGELEDLVSFSVWDPEPSARKGYRMVGVAAATPIHLSPRAFPALLSWPREKMGNWPLLCH
jgi:hypothetical protein